MYEKKAFTIEEQVQQLKDRGLFISESDKNEVGSKCHKGVV